MGWLGWLKKDFTKCPHCGKWLTGSKTENQKHKRRCKKKKKRRKAE